MCHAVAAKEAGLVSQKDEGATPNTWQSDRIVASTLSFFLKFGFPFGWASWHKMSFAFA